MRGRALRGRGLGTILKVNLKDLPIAVRDPL